MKIVVGTGSCGLAAGANKVLDSLSEAVALGKLDATVEQTGCIGMCHLEPIIDIYKGEDFTRYTKVSGQDIEAFLVDLKSIEEKKISDEDVAILNAQERIVMRNYGKIDPESIEDYIATGGYEAIQKVLKEKTPMGVIGTIKRSGLRGRGGAGFPTWFKLKAALDNASDQKYIVCNADEGDPGAFMDRSVLEGDPHSLIEGMMIAGYAIGATEGIVYVRAEYPLAIERLQLAIEQARERNILGKDVFGIEAHNFDLRIKAGAGAFVCGEETALIASLEGERGMPRLKPPFPAEKGFWGKPTNINNVETLANIPWIIANGSKAFKKFGTEKSCGTKVFALTGKIKKGGLVEIPMGMKLRDVIYDIGGGITDDKPFKAVQLGGPSGGCIPTELLDTTIDYESITKTGAIVGSGGMVVMDESTCMVEMARFFLDFTCKESCGKCTYCRVGTKRMLEILTRITKGQGVPEDMDMLDELSQKIREGSLCGLGQTAPNPVLTTLKYFRHEYEAHILEGKCPAGQCTELIEFSILADKCVGCTLCKRACPAGCISGEVKTAHTIDKEACVKCGACLAKCKFGAILKA